MVNIEEEKKGKGRHGKVKNECPNKIYKILVQTILFIFIISSLTSCNHMVKEIEVIKNVNENNDVKAEEPIEASKNGIKMSIHYGFNQSSKYGRYMKVKIEVLSEKKELGAQLQFILPNTDSDNIMYQKEIHVAKNKNSTINLQIPMTNNMSKFYVRIVDQHDKKLIQKKVSLNLSSYNAKEYVGILADNYSELTYFSNSYTKTCYLTVDDITENSLGLDSLDVIIINDFDTSKLSNEQYKAIKEWVEKGGTLVIGTGENANKTLASFQDEFLSITKKNLKKIQTTFGKNNYDETIVSIDQNVEKEKISKESTPSPTIDHERFEARAITKKYLPLEIEKAVNVVSEGKNVLLHKVNKGKGVVDVISIDLKLDSKEWNTVGSIILNEVRNTYSSYKKTQLENENKGDQNEYTILDAIRNPHITKAPIIVYYIIILLGYIILVGPLLYLVLKRKDKRHLTWVLVPAFAVLFAGSIYYLGTKTRITKPYAGYVSIVEVGDNNIANEKTFFSITAPFNKNYQYTLKNHYDITALSSNIYNSGYFDDSRLTETDVYHTALKFGDNTTTIETKDYAAFTPSFYKNETTFQLGGNINTNLHYQNYRLLGTVTNGLGFDLQNVSILCNHSIINVGNLKEGASVAVDNKDWNVMQSLGSLYTNTEFIHDIVKDSTKNEESVYDESLKEKVLNYLISNYQFNKTDGSYLIGFTKADNGGNVINDLNLKNYGVRLVVIPLDISYSDGDHELLPSIDPYMTVVEGDYTEKFRYVNNGDLICYYNFDNSQKVLSIEYTDLLNYKFNDKTWDGYTGEIYFYNLRTKEYDLIFDSDKMGVIKELDNYLDQNNNLLVKYVVDSNYASDSCTLPYLSIVREAVN